MAVLDTGPIDHLNAPRTLRLAICLSNTGNRPAIAGVEAYYLSPEESGMSSKPFDIAITPDGKQAYVANMGNSSVTVIDIPCNEVVATLPAGDAAYGIAIPPIVLF